MDLDTGQLIGNRTKIFTPQPATSKTVTKTIAGITDIVQWDSNVGITILPIIQNQVALLAANINDPQINTNCQEFFARHLPNNKAHVLNDADAAGLTEAQFGNPGNRAGTAPSLAFGAGIDSALIHDKLLYPNSELGHLIIDSMEAKHLVSVRVKDVERLGFEGWAEHVSKVLKTYEVPFWPSRIIIGGGISREHGK